MSPLKNWLPPSSPLQQRVPNSDPPPRDATTPNHHIYGRLGPGPGPNHSKPHLHHCQRDSPRHWLARFSSLGANKSSSAVDHRTTSCHAVSSCRRRRTLPPLPTFAFISTFPPDRPSDMLSPKIRVDGKEACKETLAMTSRYVILDPRSGVITEPHYVWCSYSSPHESKSPSFPWNRSWDVINQRDRCLMWLTQSDGIFKQHKVTEDINHKTQEPVKVLIRFPWYCVYVEVDSE